MNRIKIIFGLLFLLTTVFSQENPDSVYFESRIEELRNNVNSLNYRNNKLNTELNELKEDMVESEYSWRLNDSLKTLEISKLNDKLERLEVQLEDNRNNLTNGLASINTELYRMRRSTATIAIIIFSLLVIVFVYFFYRNYKMEVYVDQEIMKTSMETGKIYGKLESGFNKRIKKVAGKLENSLRKRMKKREKKLDKKISKIRKAK